MFLNEAVVLDSWGKEVFRHAKLEPFTKRDRGIEAILPRPDRNYVCLDTPVGRIAVNICRDMRSDVPMVLNRLLGSSIILVPAWSKDLTFVLEEARILGARQAAITAAANMPMPMPFCEALAAFYGPVSGRAGQHLVPPSKMPASPTDGKVVIVTEEYGFGPGRSGAAAMPTVSVV